MRLFRLNGIAKVIGVMAEIHKGEPFFERPEEIRYDQGKDSEK